MSSLKEKIEAEMTASYTNSLESNFDLAKKMISISKEGKVQILKKDKLNGKDLVLLYLVGKCYCKVAGYSDTEHVSIKELMDELGKPQGSVLPWLKKLRDKNKIKQNTSGSVTMHNIPINLIESTLMEISKKLGV